MAMKNFLILSTFCLLLTMVTALEDSSRSVADNSDSSSAEEDISDVLNIAAFKVQIFGRTKAGKADVMATLVEIVRRYDIILIQDIRDASQTAIQQLLDDVNAKGEPVYKMEKSARLGRTSSKNQYAFLYRDAISIGQTYQYPDTADDFEREPFSVKFEVGDKDVKEIVLVALQAKPDKADEELEEMDEVLTIIEQQMGTENILLLGDVLADCGYLTATEMAALTLKNDAKYHWLIDDDVDTMITATDCAYDRFVLTGEDFLDTIVPDSPGVFRFDTEYGLTNAQALDVSNHYPIELQMVIRDGGPIDSSEERK